MNALHSNITEDNSLSRKKKKNTSLNFERALIVQFSEYAKFNVLM